MDSFRPHLKDRLRHAFREGSDRDLIRRARGPEEITRIRQIAERAIVRINRSECLFRGLYESRIGREVNRLMMERASFRK